MRLLSLSRLRALGRDERGTAIVELAMIAPVLALLTIGITDLSQGITRRMELSEAVHRTLEKAAAQQFQFTSTTTDPDYSFLKDDTVEAAGGEAAGVTADDVEVIVWLECDGEEIVTSEDEDYADTSCAAGQATARYLQIRINSFYKPSFGTFVSPDPDGTVPLWAEAAVRIQ